MIIHAGLRRVEFGVKGQVNRVVGCVRSQQNGSTNLERTLVCELNGIYIMQTRARLLLMFGRIMEVLSKRLDELNDLVAWLVIQGIFHPSRDCSG